MAGKIFEGVVSSNKMQKTIVVTVSRRYREERAGKIVSTRKKYKVHCEDTSLRVGDLVSFIECRPLSKDKKWRFKGITRRAAVVEASTEDAVTL